MGRGDATPLRPFMFKPGQSGNPGGRPKGKTMKQYAREYLAAMPEEERIKFLSALDLKTIWEMGEGKPKQDIEVEGEMVSKVIVADE